MGKVELRSWRSKYCCGNRWRSSRRFWPSDDHQTPRCMELLEVRAAPDVQARKRRNRQRLFAGLVGAPGRGTYHAASTESSGSRRALLSVRV